MTHVVDDHTALLITNLFGSLAKPTTVVIPNQSGSNDCGVYAIANAAAICIASYSAFQPSSNETTSSPVFGAEENHSFPLLSLQLV